MVCRVNFSAFLPKPPSERFLSAQPARSPMTPEDQETWRRALSRFREDKDEWLRTSPDSPLMRALGNPTEGLNYFDPDPTFRFEVGLQRYATPDSLILGTSKGSRQVFNRMGHFDIAVGGQQVRVHAYQSAERDDPHLFIPFRDSTSGRESYGAARYIDLEVEHDDEYALDFNYAYNPYCAYSDDYVCPLPPQENWLRVPITAGEKKFHE